MGTYATPTQLADALRVSVTPKNSALLTAAIDAASVEIDHEVGRRTGEELEDDDPLAHSVCLARGVEWFKSNDAVFGVVGFADTGVLAAPADGFARHAANLVPLKQTYGVA